MSIPICEPVDDPIVSLRMVLPMTAQNDPADPQTQNRADWVQALALSPPDWLEDRWRALKDPPAYTHMRSPQVGLAMVRGRMAMCAAGTPGTPSWSPCSMP